MAKDDLTTYARQGFTAEPGAKCPFIVSSSAELAWKVGVWFNKTGRTEPRDVRMSRGYTMRANDMLLDVSNSDNVIRIS